MYSGVPPTQPVRHPLDPDPVRSTKALAVLALGVVAVLFSPVVAGALPAVVALLLARDTVAEMRASEGFLTGLRYLRVGSWLATLALVIATAVVLIGIVVGLFHLFGTGGTPVFGPGVD